ncbi:MAG: hypothetical protein J2P49_10670, partial [Methylocapsa sp.]|nr:hypothetical protein [Methylocapsa sp.]
MLRSFTGGRDGASPHAGLIFDSRGNLYGTAFNGGDWKCTDISGPGCGVAFRRAPNGAETVLYAFAAQIKGNMVDGANPAASLIFESKGNPLGTTEFGGLGGPGCGFGCGTIFELSPPAAAHG